MELNYQQKEILNAREPFVICHSSVGSGKAQPNSLLIPTPQGERRVGDIRPGDYVFGRKGKPIKVLEIFPQGKKRVYIVKFLDGRETRCCKEHLWSYKKSTGTDLDTCSLADMIENGTSRIDCRGYNHYKYKVPVLRNAVLYEHKDFQIDPYIIGAFIGDGGCRENYLHMSSNDPFIIEKIAGLEKIDFKRRSEYDFHWDFFKEGKCIKTKSFFSAFEKEICCYNFEKRIPIEYLYGDEQQRLELLRGLMDTDGTVGDGRHSPEFSTTSPRLAEDVQKLVRSLGFYSTISQLDRRPQRPYIEYSVRIFVEPKEIQKIFSLPRKIEKAKSFQNYQYKRNHLFDSIVAIEETNDFEEMTCFLVDAEDHLYLTNDYIVTHNTRLLTEKVKQSIDAGKNTVAFTFTNMAAAEMRARVGYQNNEKLFIGTIHSYCAHLLLRRGVTEALKLIENENFDELFNLFFAHPECKPEIDICLCDEAQDSNEEQCRFIFEGLKTKEYFIVLDTRQCQPEGTKILMADGTEKNIENLQVGDSIISYDKGRITGGKPDNTAKNTITRIEKRFIPTDEKIIKITTSSGKISRYTKNHICLTKLCKCDDHGYFVYLMCNNKNYFRVGKSQFRNNNTPWRDKMSAEGCAKIWILKTFQTDKEACAYRDKISCKYSIPQTAFQFDKTFHEDRDFIYEGLDSSPSAKRCLEDHQRDIRFPFASAEDDIYYTGNAFNECYACNILPENMQVKEFTPEEPLRQIDTDIIKLEYEEGYDVVYSLDVSPSHIYIADGIITHNCIYSFAGARPDLVFTYGRRNGAKIYSMNRSYRCGRDILNFARRTLAKAQINDDTIPVKETRGTVALEPYSEDIIASYLLDPTLGQFGDWAIITRTNAQIRFIVDLLKEIGIPCDTFRQGDLKKEELDSRMSANTVKVLTSHSAKGLEWNNVIAYGLWMKKAEEARISYVAITRAKNLIIWMSAAKKKDTKVVTW